MDAPTNPIQALHLHAANLEAAVSASLADPTREAVHSLRSEARRIEAQLDLLKEIEELPPYRPAADKLRRRLRKLRRPAGEVRDCDVQRKLLKDSDGELRSQYESLQAWQEDTERLIKVLGKRRRSKARRLLDSLERQKNKLSLDVQTLLALLPADEADEVAAEELLKRIERRFLRAASFRETSEEQLHTVRKAAKLARYQCEALPGEAAAAFAVQMEELQDVGGAWHDLLVLAEHSVEELGVDHPLSRVLERVRDERLTRYVERLQAFRLVRASERMRGPSRRRAEQAIEAMAQQPRVVRSGAANLARKGVQSARPAVSFPRKMTA